LRGRRSLLRICTPAIAIQDSGEYSRLSETGLLMYPACTSLERIRCLWRFPRLMKSATSTLSIRLRIPTPAASRELARSQRIASECTVNPESRSLPRSGLMARNDFRTCPSSNQNRSQVPEIAISHKRTGPNSLQLARLTALVEEFSKLFSEDDLRRSM
jgi:hypothetical protein